MFKRKFTKLALIVAGTMLALGGCSGGGWLPWAVGIGVVTLLGQQA